MSLGAKHEVMAIAPQAWLGSCRNEYGAVLYFIADDSRAADFHLSGLHRSPVKAWQDALARLTARMAQSGGAA